MCCSDAAQVLAVQLEESNSLLSTVRPTIWKDPDESPWEEESGVVSVVAQYRAPVTIALPDDDLLNISDDMVTALLLLLDDADEVSLEGEQDSVSPDCWEDPGEMPLEEAGNAISAVQIGQQQVDNITGDLSRTSDDMSDADCWEDPAETPVEGELNMFPPARGEQLKPDAANSFGIGVLRASDSTLALDVLRASDSTVDDDVLRRSDSPLGIDVLRASDSTVDDDVLRVSDSTLDDGFTGSAWSVSADSTVELHMAREHSWEV